MKKIAFALLISLISVPSFSQDFEKGGNYITAGFGLDPWGYPKGNAYGYTGNGYKRTAIGPIVATYERGITDVLGIGRIGVGGGIAQSWYTQKYTYTYSGGTYEDVYRTSRTSILLRAAYHFEFDIPKMDFYAGVGASINIHSYTDREWYQNTDPSSPNFGQIYEEESKYRTVGRGYFHQVYAGIRYFFTPAFGVYAEVGHGVYVLNGGLVFHF